MGWMTNKTAINHLLCFDPMAHMLFDVGGKQLSLGITTWEGFVENKFFIPN